jgi:hypothetical protein
LKRKLRKIEALAFGKLDAELRNYIQGIQIINFKIKDLEREKQELRNLIETKNKQYQQLLDTLASKYKIQNKHDIEIDPDLGTIKEKK